MDQQSPTGHYGQLARDICAEWDLAEADIKLAEQVCSEVVIPSINELRYAGRRVIEVLALFGQEEEPQKSEALYNDARFFCHRARHDAIDASVAHMVLSLDTMLSTIGPAIVMRSFSDLATFRFALANVQKNFVESRKDRESRTKIYKTISECDFPSLIEMHNKLVLSETLMTEVAQAESNATWWNVVFGLGGLLVGVMGFATAVVAWKYPHLLGAS